MSQTTSREKLVAHLKGAIVSTDTENDYHFVYHLGRNMLCEELLMKIICGEMDE